MIFFPGQINCHKESESNPDRESGPVVVKVLMMDRLRK